MHTINFIYDYNKYIKPDTTDILLEPKITIDCDKRWKSMSSKVK